MTIKIIIFDFDGTIADTFDAIVRITNRLSTEFGYKPASAEDVVKFKELTPKEIINQSGISIFKLPFILKRVKADLNSEIESVAPVSGIKEALLDLKNKGYNLGIITSNSKANVNIFLQCHGLKDVFSFIGSGTTIFGKNKIINNFLKHENINLKQAIYVGDEARDIDAAKRSNIKVIAVSWGFNSKEVLARQHPDFLIHHPQELIEVIGSLEQQASYA